MGEHKQHSSSRKHKNRSSDDSRDDKRIGNHRGGAASEMEDSFQARPTNRMGKDHKIKADGDTWQEMMAVCEAPEGMNENEDGTPQLVVRSYYQNSRTNERVWDEPPSGATNIIPASDEVRRMATLQLDELHVVKKGKKKSEKKKTLIGRIFGTNKKKDKKKVKRRIEYKPGSQMYAGKATQDTEDAMMQEAIAASIAESKGEAYVRPPPGQQSSLEDEMAMAQALSMSAAEQDAEANALAHALSLSAAEHETVPTETQDIPQMHQAQTEEEILAQVMEQSKLQTKRGEGDLLDLSASKMNMIAPNNPFDAPMSPEDRKMPASGSAAVNQYPMYQQIQQDNLQFPAMAPASNPFDTAPAGSMPPPSTAASAPNPSAHYAASSNAAAAASASQYAAAMAAAASPSAAAAVSPPNMKAPPSYSMPPDNSSSSPPPPSTYPSSPTSSARYLDPQQELLQIDRELAVVRSESAASYPQQHQQQQMRIPVNAPPMTNTTAALKKPPPPPVPLTGAAADATPFTTAPILNSRTSTTASQPSAMFDPYSKDATTPSGARLSTSGAHTSSSASNGLQKMGGSSEAAPRKMSIFKRKSTSASTKVQDRAGLV